MDPESREAQLLRTINLFADQFHAALQRVPRGGGYTRYSLHLTTGASIRWACVSLMTLLSNMRAVRSNVSGLSRPSGRQS